MRIFAHRGLNRQAPENTIAAFELAAAAGLKWLETDVDILGDATPVIIHDSTLDRTTDASGSIYDLKKSDLKTISAGAKFPDSRYKEERIPRLVDLVKFLQKTKMRCNLELKSNEGGGKMSRKMLQTVIERGVDWINPERLLVSSFNPVLLYLLHQERPNTELACLFTKDNLWPDAVSICELVGARTIHPEDSGLTQETVRHLKKAKLTVNVWTVNDLERARELESWGVDGIFTDIGDQMKSQLKG